MLGASMSDDEQHSGSGFRLHGIVRAYEVHPGLAQRLAPGQALLGEMARQARREGTMVQVMEQHNLVVNSGMQAIAKFLGGAAGAPTVGGLAVGSIDEIVVATMQLGNAGSPPAPSDTDTVGVTSLLYQPPMSVSYPTAYSIMFSGVVPQLEAVGATFTEEALILANGKLFARSTFSRSKGGSFALQFDHTILFSRS